MIGISLMISCTCPDLLLLDLLTVSQRFWTNNVGTIERECTRTGALLYDVGFLEFLQVWPVSKGTCLMTSSCSDSFCKAQLKQVKDLHSTLLTCSTDKIRTATGTQFEIEISQEFVIPFLNIWQAIYILKVHWVQKQWNYQQKLVSLLLNIKIKQLEKILKVQQVAFGCARCPSCTSHGNTIACDIKNST